MNTHVDFCISHTKTIGVNIELFAVINCLLSTVFWNMAMRICAHPATSNEAGRGGLVGSCYSNFKGIYPVSSGQLSSFSFNFGHTELTFQD